MATIPFGPQTPESAKLGHADLSNSSTAGIAQGPIATESTLDMVAFLAKYRISTDTFQKTGLKWPDLQEIYFLHLSKQPGLLLTAAQISERLRTAPGTHSLKLRIKDPEHLIEKIIRKTIEKPALKITPDNYAAYVTDLIGLRVLHLFKENWVSIHDFIKTEWSFKERPTANIRRGDSEEIVSAFKARGCGIKEHKLGYRSIHYLVVSQPTKEVHLAEVQVRTIFEEGWSEIDHAIRYPYGIANSALSRMLGLFNRFAGGADEMGSYIRSIHTEEKSHAAQASENSAKREEAIREIITKVDSLGGSSDNRSLLKSMITGLATFANGQDDGAGILDTVQLASQQQRRLDQHAADWLARQHRSHSGLLLPVVMGKRYGTKRSWRSLRTGERLVILDGEDSSLDVYDADGRRIGRLQNDSPLDYDVFCQAMKLCYGNTPWPVRVVQKSPPEKRSVGWLSWLQIAVEAQPIDREPRIRRRRVRNRA